jgi:hypothetical protein
MPTSTTLPRPGNPHQSARTARPRHRAEPLLSPLRRRPRQPGWPDPPPSLITTRSRALESRPGSPHHQLSTMRRDRPRCYGTVGRSWASASRKFLDPHTHTEFRNIAPGCLPFDELLVMTDDAASERQNWPERGRSTTDTEQPKTRPVTGYLATSGRDTFTHRHREHRAVVASQRAGSMSASCSPRSNRRDADPTICGSG